MKRAVQSVNIGSPQPNPYKGSRVTGIHKRPVDGPVTVSAPDSTSRASGLAGDFIGDTVNHGGPGQAVYAFQREDLDRWELLKDRSFPNGSFGENLTTIGIDVNEALIGEQWRIGTDVVLEITGPRIPCSTFRGVIADPTWLRRFTQDSRPGAYFRVIAGGTIRAGDVIEVINTPPHDISVAVAFQAITTDRSLLARLRAAAEWLPAELVSYAATAVVDTDHE